MARALVAGSERVDDEVCKAVVQLTKAQGAQGTRLLRFVRGFLPAPIGIVSPCDVRRNCEYSNDGQNHNVSFRFRVVLLRVFA